MIDNASSRVVRAGEALEMPLARKRQRRLPRTLLRGAVRARAIGIGLRETIRKANMMSPLPLHPCSIWCRSLTFAAASARARSERAPSGPRSQPRKPRAGSVAEYESAREGSLRARARAGPRRTAARQRRRGSETSAGVGASPRAKHRRLRARAPR